MKVEWIDSGREPQCPPDPAYPHGRDIALPNGIKKCRTELPYPAKRCGYYLITCPVCRATAMLTTAGRTDDPRSVELPCRKPGLNQ